MASVFKMSRFGKIAVLSGIGGGSLYFFRDEIKPLFKSLSKPNKELDRIQDIPVAKSTNIEHLPEKIPYLLVGGGTASHAAMRAIRGHDPKAKVLIVTSESHTPYMRPALSKELWYTNKDLRRTLNFKWWNGKERSIFYEMDEFFIPLDVIEKRETGGVSIIKNIRLTRLDPSNKMAYLENGQTIKYDKCLLAPGGRPKTLPVLEAASSDIKSKILYFRTADDFLKLDKISETARKILIVGGGFLGSELACALSNRISDDVVPKDQTIYQVYPEAGNLDKILPRYLSEYVTKKVEAEGAHPIPNSEIKSVKMAADKTIEVTLSNGQVINVDCIVCTVGLEPDVDLAKSSGLEIDEKTGGYLVNSELEARTNIWVAGDAACFYDIKLGRRQVEHHDHAINSGRLAGQNMVGSGQPYTHQSMFWSDLGPHISFEAVGVVESSLPTVSVFCEPEKNDKGDESDKYSKGVVFYLRDGVIVGILLWNVFNRLTIARRVLDEQKKYEDFNEVAKLFNLYVDE